ncbi:kinase-like domain-containing protein [Stachybotrys elegans]|uniref:Kinase-like domain-containing protein n=1 Tax=Stachybotrys elegans TaxID=80388 RepID=A0A8K0SRK3_9HYPO|nr:kinase-like domain-containing protein [Stachybotrys elegans]
MDEEIKVELAGTPFAPSKLRPLTGGTANFIYHAVLNQPLPDGTTEVAIKHGEGYIASQPDWKLSTSRCGIEEECLRLLAGLPACVTSGCTVSTPKLYSYDPQTHTQVQEYLPNAANLKQYSLDRYKAPTPSSLEPQCLQLGQCLGQWLQSFHEWSRQPDHASFRQAVSRNKDLQLLKHMINYQTLPQKAEQHPQIMGDVKDILLQISEATTAELQDETKLEVIHGDFWTGNVLLPIESSGKISVKIIDWEMAQLGLRPVDLGQFIAELWQLKLYKDIEAAVWMIKGFVQGYGKLEPDFAFRVLLHVGAHLVCFGSTTPGWGTAEQQAQVLKTGKDLLVKSWGKDRAAFDGHDLECLFS